jgi:hypothetical protein
MTGTAVTAMVTNMTVTAPRAFTTRTASSFQNV